MAQQPSHPSWIGHTISGRYKIEAVLGQGGMSSVYKATDPNLHRTVAVKLIHPHLSSDPEFVRRFEQEAAAVAQLRHQNIIQVYDFDHDGNVYFMVLEYLPGQTLQEKLSALNATNQRMPLEESVKTMATICDAVAYAHDNGMIHRDLKPANVMLNPNGQPVLMDFGVAKMLGSSQHTATGAIIGTAKYMSPEQARGERPDGRTDIYSLGVMLYEMVTGATPFEGESTVAILMKHVTESLPNIRQISTDIPEDVVQVIEKSLAKTPDQRYQTAADMAAALRAVNLATHVAPASAPPPEPDPDTTILHTTPSPTIAPVRPPAPAPAVQPAEPASQGGFPMWIIGAAAVVLLLIVGGIIGMFAFGGGSEADSTPDAQATSADVAAGADETATPTTELTAEATTTEPPPTATPRPTEAPDAENGDVAAEDGASDALPTTTEVATEENGGAEASDALPTATEEPEPTATPSLEPSPTPEPEATAPPAAPPPPGMVSVPAGFFLMGSSSGEALEQPEHPVLLDGFFIDQTEVTNAEYAECVTAGSCIPANTVDSFTRSGYRDDPAFANFPVISVSWDQAQAYCSFVGKRLPTEAEWEYAASGPKNLTYPWGNSFNVSLSAAGSEDTEPVGSFPGGASPFGVLDMAGNVGEWVADVSVEGFYANSPPSNPVAAGGGAARIFRGGSFANPDGEFYRTSKRYGTVRSFSEVDIGVRCAQDAPNAEPSPALVDEFCAVYAEFNPGGACP